MSGTRVAEPTATTSSLALQNRISLSSNGSFTLSDQRQQPYKKKRTSRLVDNSTIDEASQYISPAPPSSREEDEGFTFYRKVSKNVNQAPQVIQAPQNDLNKSQQTPKLSNKKITEGKSPRKPSTSTKEAGQNPSRRSSLSLRGKRAKRTSNPSHFIPHPELPSNEFYKHISPDLDPTERMKQLISWTGLRSMERQESERLNHDKDLTYTQSTASSIAKIIEKEVLQDLLDSKISIDWKGRSPQDVSKITSIGMKKHPRNVSNLQSLQYCRQAIEKLRKEEEKWQAILSTHEKNSKQFLESLKLIDLPADAVAPELANAKDIQGLEETEKATDTLYQTKYSVKSLLELMSEMVTVTLAKVSKHVDKKLGNYDNIVGINAADNSQDVCQNTDMIEVLQALTKEP